MARMGHSSPRAALIYQHATRDRDEAIASALSDLVSHARAKPASPVPSLGDYRVRAADEGAELGALSRDGA
ncbi:MAG TPA: hypothetical protein VK988_04930 [Acidimicrobiales bacterium]|nr:hypothetical protein [Acidimicrobiales bacterium]